MKLFIENKLFNLKEKMEVTDEAGKVVYRTHTAFFSITDTTTIENAVGDPVARLKARLLSIHRKYDIELADGRAFELSNQLFRLNVVIDIPDLGWQLRSRNLMAFDFDITDGAGNLVATAHNPVSSLLRDRYELDVFDDANADAVVAIFIALRHILAHRNDG